MTIIAGVILAAGAGRRMGRPKQLLPWGDTTVLGQTIRNAQHSRLDSLLVVTGFAAPAVAAAAAQQGVPVVDNPDYAAGEMLSSVQTAVAALPPEVHGALILLADQPFVGPGIIDALRDAFDAGLGTIVAPAFDGRRGNPVLIGRTHFPALLALPHGAAPRDLLAVRQADIHLVAVDDEAVLRDLDRPEEYERWRP